MNAALFTQFDQFKKMIRVDICRAIEKVIKFGNFLYKNKFEEKKKKQIQKAQNTFGNSTFFFHPFIDTRNCALQNES